MKTKSSTFKTIKTTKAPIKFPVKTTVVKTKKDVQQKVQTNTVVPVKTKTTYRTEQQVVHHNQQSHSPTIFSSGLSPIVFTIILCVVVSILIVNEKRR